MPVTAGSNLLAWESDKFCVENMVPLSTESEIELLLPQGEKIDRGEGV